MIPPIQVELKLEEESSWMVPCRRHGVGGEAVAGEVGVAGEGRAGLAVDQKADLCDAGKIGMEGGADGEYGECLGFKAGGVARRECAGEVYDGEFGAGFGVLCG
jgi:hypothetical protein